MSNTPSDAEIIELMRDGYNCRYNDEADHIEFARAVLAKWAAPQQEAQEPFGWACWIGDDNDPKRAQFSACEPLAYQNRIKLYTAPQPAAPQAAPAVDEQSAQAARWRLVEHAPSSVTLRLHNLRPDQRAQYIDAALAAQGGA